jgi:hypothetical protein
MDGLFIGLHATAQLPDVFHPISIVCQDVDPLDASGRDSLRDLVPA